MELILFRTLLRQIFLRVGSAVPRSIRVLDIGAGQWEYADALISFLQNYGVIRGKRSVKLVGIDPLKEKLKSKIPNGADYLQIDVMDLNQKEKFDLIFLIHPFPNYRLKEHGLPIHRPKKLFRKILSLLKPKGYFIAITYGSPPEEYGILDCFPKENLILKERYYDKRSMEEAYKLGFDSFNNNMVIIARK